MPGWFSGDRYIQTSMQRQRHWRVGAWAVLEDLVDLSCGRNQMPRKKRTAKTESYLVDPDTGSVRITPRKRLLERQTPTEGLVAAFDRVHESLAAATELMLHHGDGGRAGVHQAMKSLIDYFTSQGIPYATVEPITEVMKALVESEQGVTNPIFSVKRYEVGGRPPKPINELTKDGYLGIVMECCVRHCKAAGMRPFVRPAAEKAAQLINGSVWDVKVTAAELTNIRERISQSAADSPDRIAVDSTLSSDLARQHPLQWAKMLLSHDWVNLPPEVSQ